MNKLSAGERRSSHQKSFHQAGTSMMARLRAESRLPSLERDQRARRLGGLT